MGEALHEEGVCFISVEFFSPTDDEKWQLSQVETLHITHEL
jgi:hypothetical protein